MASQAPRFHNTPGAIAKWVKKLSPECEVVSYCYEAGFCDYGVYRQFAGLVMTVSWRRWR